MNVEEAKELILNRLHERTAEVVYSKAIFRLEDGGPDVDVVWQDEMHDKYFDAACADSRYETIPAYELSDVIYDAVGEAVHHARADTGCSRTGGYEV